MIKFYITLCIIVIIGGAFYGAKYYYDSTQAELQRLAAEKEILDSALERQTASFQEIQLQMNKQIELNGELQVNLEKANTGLSELRSIFTRHDLTRLALARPGLIEARINNGTFEVFREIEQTTGNNSPIDISE